MVDCDSSCLVNSTECTALAGPCQGFMRRAFRSATTKFGEPKGDALTASASTDGSVNANAIASLLGMASGSGALNAAPKPKTVVDIADGLKAVNLARVDAHFWSVVLCVCLRWVVFGDFVVPGHRRSLRPSWLSRLPSPLERTRTLT